MQTSILFYNVENLFDTLDDPLTNDNAYLPGSSLKWIEKRYVLKLQRIARVLKEEENPMPGIVGLAEVENRKVLKDLVSALGLSEDEVGIVHTDSPDERGMDVGLLYRKELFRDDPDQPPENLTIFFEDDPSDKTRDVLRVPLLDQNGERIIIYVSHWPSRKEGIQATRDKRITVAEKIRASVMETLNHKPEERIILMGDLNCTPDSPPVYKLLDKKANPNNPLINLSWDLHLQNKGSTNYRGKWLMFDQILVSSGFQDFYLGDCVPGHRSGIYSKCMNVIKHKWMLYYNSRYKQNRPNKTYGGNKYHGGFSDHLPVSIKLSTNRD